MIDHIDGDITNNRRSNLREVTRSVNNYNSNRKPNKYGCVGVSKLRNKFKV